MQERFVFQFARASFAIVFIWFGAMNFTSIGASTVGGWIDGHALVSDLLPAAQTAKAIGALQIITAILIAAPGLSGRLRAVGFWMAAAYSAGALSLMFTNPVWIEAIGGFPAIGAGQGIIKYLPILGLALWGAAAAAGRDGGAGRNITLLGLILVLGWIGGMKFTLVEAQGIDPLVRTSPIFSWMPKFFSLQTTSNIIGVIELVAVAGLAGYWVSRPLFYLGAALSAATFLTTLSFLITFGPSWSADLGGFPALARTGHFLLKDLLLLAGVIVVASHRIRRSSD
ncbi:MAG: hypothetical protein Tsb0010_14720 [Parvularculaceae bacterium]